MDLQYAGKKCRTRKFNNIFDLQYHRKKMDFEKLKQDWQDNMKVDLPIWRRRFPTPLGSYWEECGDVLASYVGAWPPHMKNYVTRCFYFKKIFLFNEVLDVRALY